MWSLEYLSTVETGQYLPKHVESRVLEYCRDQTIPTKSMWIVESRVEWSRDSVVPTIALAESTVLQ
jgi:hypothetical protein